jgi:hypothetical protein
MLLVADDTANMRKCVRNLTVSDRQATFEVIQKDRPALILTDIYDAGHAWRRIAARYPSKF